jgi:hypothetical protein
MTTGKEPLTLLCLCSQRKRFAFSQAVAFVFGFDNVTIMTKSTQERSSHFAAAEDLWPFIKSKIDRDDDRCFLIHL